MDTRPTPKLIKVQARNSRIVHRAYPALNGIRNAYGVGQPLCNSGDNIAGQRRRSYFLHAVGDPNVTCKRCRTYTTTNEETQR